MNNHLRSICLLLFLLGFTIKSSRAQETFATENDLKKQAAKYFEDDEFEAAYPLYTQLASIYPKDADYSYRLGVSILYAVDDKEKPIPFLEFAVNKDVEKEVLYYLARAYHLNYRFDDAIKEYNEYKKVASANKAQKLQVDRQIEMCKNGKQLLRNLTDLVVIDKKEMSKEDFFRAYDFSQIGGKLLAKPDEKQFRTATDKKKKEKSVIYLASNNNQVFFSSYGEDGTKGKDIFTTNRLENGEWSKPQNLGFPVNTDYDEDFPFLHPNGKDLFFCSKGHNSMGGYDVFKTTYNEQTKTWSNPVNMDFPINTPDDDILYVTDTAEKQAYFSSARSSIKGKTEVYHINVERKPIDASIIKGSVVKNRDDEKLDVKITVKDLNSNNIIGIFNSFPTDGSYDLKLPNGGKFLFTVESASFATQSEVVVIPVQHEFKPMKQEISYELKTDKLLVKNIFDAVGDDSNYLLALKYIKDKSKLEVNANEVAVNTKNEVAVSASGSQKNEPATKTSAKANAPLTNNDIVKIANDDASEVETDAKDAKEQADIALNYANQRNETAQAKTKEATALLEEAAKTDDNVKKQAIVAKANDASKEADVLNQETVAAFNVAKKLDMAAASKQKEADLSKQYAKDLEAAVKSKSSAQAMAKLDEQAKKLEELSKENAANVPITNSFKLDAENKKKELDKAIKEAKDSKQETDDNETIIKDLQVELAAAKKDDLKKGLETQIADLTIDNKAKVKELAQKEARVTQLQKEYDGIKNELELVNTVVEQAKSGSSETASATAATIDKTKLEAQVNEIKKTVQTSAVVVNNGPKNGEVASVNKQTTTTKEQKTVSNQSLGAVSQQSNLGKQETNLGEQESNASKQESNLGKLEGNASNQQSNLGNQETNLGKQEGNASNQQSNLGKQQSNVSNQQTSSSNPSSSIGIETINKRFGEELGKTKSIPDALEQEQAKLVVLKNYNKAIEEEVTNEQTILKSTTKEEDKKEVAKKIADASQLSKNIKAQSEESIAKVEALKKQQNVVASKSTVDSLKTNANSNGVESKGNNQQLLVDNKQGTKFKTLDSINKKYTDEVAATSKITNELEREQAKSEKLKDWNNAIASTIIAKQEKLKTINNQEEKKTVEKEISNEEQFANEIKLQSDESTTKLEKLKQQQNAVAVDNKTNKTATKEDSGANQQVKTNELLEKINEKYANEIKTTDNIKDEVSKEQTKTEVLKKWDADLTAEIKNQKEVLKTAKTNEDKIVIEKNINDSEKQSIEVKKKEEESLAKLETLKKQEEVKVTSSSPIAENKKNADSAKTVAAETKIAPNQTGTASTSNKLTNVDSTEKNNVEKPVVKVAVEPTGFVYQSSKSVEQLAKIDMLAKQAEDLTVDASKLQAQAGSQKNETTRKAMNDQADELIKESETKKFESAKLEAVLNNNEFINNQVQLDNLSKSLANKNIDELSTADLINDEATIYFNKAQKLRTAADSSKSFNEKENALSDAYSNEMIALEKQKRATDIYKKYNQSGAVLANTVNTNTKTTTTTTTKKVSEQKNIESAATIPENSVVSGTTKNQANSNTKATTETNSGGNNLEVKNAVSDNKNNADNAKGVVSTKTKTTIETNLEDTNSVVKNAVSENKNNADSTKSVVNSNAKTTSTTDQVNANTNKKDTSNTLAVAQNNKSNQIQTSKNTQQLEQIKKEEATNNQQPTANLEKQTDNATFQKKATTLAPAITLAPSELFERRTIPIYSAQKPIPVNEKLPEGLVFKVQVGAFRKPIPQDLFKGITPITGETTPQGYTRYMAGVFVKYNSADNVKNQIKDLGYKDAFVVAFLNGKRIPISQAYSLAGVSVPTNAIATQQSSSVQNNETKTNAKSEVNNNPATTNAPQPIVNSAEVAPSQNVTTIGGGLFYTVQVGVYSQPVSSAKLYNTQPLYTETAPNGNLRYNTGVYNNVARAVEAKKLAIDAGIKDAFVTAYYNGKRISLTEAKQYETQGNIQFPTTPNINALPRFASDNNNVSQPIEAPKKSIITKEQPILNPPQIVKQEKPVISTTKDSVSKELNKTVVKNNVVIVDSGVVFKVQIGAFKDEVPIDIANKFFKIASKGIKNYKDENGLTVYTVGSFKTYEEASKARADVAAEELTDAFIVVYNNGKKITIDEAKQLINK